MGNTRSKEEKKEVSILRKLQHGEASDFYWACRNGDLDCVRKIFFSTDFIDINQLEPNGSTALHAASYFGHFHVVQFLLEHGIFRHRRNRYGLTAYEETHNNKIRELFHRPSKSQRFSTNRVEDVQRLFTLEIEELTEDEDTPPNDWIEKGSEEKDIVFVRAGFNSMKTVLNSSIWRPILMAFLKRTGYDSNLAIILNEKVAMQKIQRLIDTCVTSSHPEYKKACELLAKYDKSKNVQHLLRLYSLETPFYQYLGRGTSADCLLFPILFKLDTLKNRGYQGCSYRGLTLTKKDLRAYKWAFKHQSSILVTNSFCSSSVNKNVALSFIRNVSEEKIGVLMVFNFAETCDTAIQLFTLSKDLPGISDFEDEREVLILPYTLFHVTNIDTDKTTIQQTIYLENVTTKGGLFSLYGNHPYKIASSSFTPLLSPSSSSENR
ncbi:unnamed protein product [Rotaria sp. Silwood1]|nr:unnamed protein product [Rotaria sp. Silwood1]